MENWTYHKDYSEYWAKLEKNGDELSEQKIALILEFGEYQSTAKKIINPTGKHNFDTMLSKCDAYAQNIGGIIDAKIDYSTYEARIFLEAPFFEFIDEDERELLVAATILPQCVHFSPMDNGWINMSMTFPYFVSLHTKDDANEHHRRMQELAGALD